ncbi:MAG: four-carbon acid sugar kinase family protein [Lachnospiraceae bacterium]|nr:four-carbon acid sugar kinase family protein [Lachnospiraceae bacterium]
MKLLIIADDFTGALDTGVQLSKHSIRTVVMTSPDDIPSIDQECQVLVINADIRHACPEEAYECICSLLYKYMEDFSHVYLKTDSVLRGNLSAVFAAALHVCRKPLCFIPAFPELNRITRDATAYVNGQRLEDSVFRDDPRSPAVESYIPAILNRDYPVRCLCISHENYHLFTETSLDCDTVYLFDCETNEQLRSIGSLIQQQNLYTFTAGCAGFASTFAEHLPFNKALSSISKSSGPVLFVSGSANAVTLQQLVYARGQGYPVIPLAKIMFSNTDYITSTPENKDFFKDFQYLEIVKQAVTSLQNGQSVILATAVEQKELESNTPCSSDTTTNYEKNLHNYIARYTSSLVKSIIDEMEPDDSSASFGASSNSLKNLAVFGGDMAAAILNQLSCHQVCAAGEITAGVPLCEIQYKGQAVHLVTKSGGFGEADMIPVIEHYLRKL